MPLALDQRNMNKNMLRYYLVLLGGLMAVSSNAQVVDTLKFTPLQIGDTWEYVYTGQHWPVNHDPNPSTLLGYLSIAVSGDTLIEGELYRVLTQNEFNKSGLLLNTTSCATQVLNDGTVVHDVSERTFICSWESWVRIPFLPIPPRSGSGNYNYHTITEGGEIDIGNQTYAVEAIALAATSGPHSIDWRLNYAAGLGLYKWVHTNPPNVTLAGIIRQYDLIYASVSGQVYGRTAVSEESAAPPVPELFVLSAPFPNPVSEEAQFSIFTSTPGLIEVEAFDSIGRRVLLHRVHSNGFETVVQINLASVASGVYYLRATDPIGRIITKPLTKR